MKYTITIFLFFLISSPAIAQERQTLLVTLKAGIGLSIVPSKYYLYPSYSPPYDIVHTFYMPSINAGIFINNWIYFGGFYTWKTNETFPKKHLTTAEIGVPIVKRFIVGVSYGREYYWAPSDGGAHTVMEDKIPAYGGFIDYKFMEFLSTQIRCTYVADTHNSHGPSYYINLGVTGNLTIHKRQNK